MPQRRLQDNALRWSRKRSKGSSLGVVHLTQHDEAGVRGGERGRKNSEARDLQLRRGGLRPCGAGGRDLGKHPAEKEGASVREDGSSSASLVYL